MNKRENMIYNAFKPVEMTVNMKIPHNTKASVKQ